MKILLSLVHVLCLVQWVRSDAEPILKGDEGPIITVGSLGKVKGRLGKSFSKGRTIYEFFGINYAKAPSGVRRFKPPEEFEAWNYVYDATKMRRKCPQINLTYYPDPDFEFDDREDIEDCLVLNVFTTKTLQKSNERMPVMFYIHGGSFFLGSAYDFLPDFLLEEDIVLVVPQYRLGPLGFLSLYTNDVPGNMAMLDILMALRWTKNNIQYFGGDPEKITVSGQSAGAAAASTLLISPLVEKGLFDKMILQSGSALAPWSVDNDPIKSARVLATILNCPADNIEAMTFCLKTKSPMDIVMAHAKLTKEMAEGGGGMAVSSLVIETRPNGFLTKHPSVAFSEGPLLRVPTMGGTTRDEGSSFMMNVYDNLKLVNITDTRYLQRNITREVLGYFGYKDPYGLMTDYVHNMHFGEGTNGVKEMLPGLVDICGATLMKEPTYNVLRIMSYVRPTYAYSFNFYGGISKLRASEPKWDENYPFPAGVAHSDELGYLFPSLRSNYTSREMKMVKTMTKFWTNFIRFGSPVTEKESKKWPPMSTSYGPYLRISDKMEIRQNFFDESTIASREGFVNASSGKSKFYASLIIPLLLAVRSLYLNILPNRI